MSSNFQRLFGKLRVYHGAEALVAALFSLFASGGVLWLIRGMLYGKLPVYEELVAGGTVWDGYNKQGDMTLFYLLYLLIPFFFCLFLYIKHTIMLPRETAWEGQKKEESVSGKTAKSQRNEKVHQDEWKTWGMLLLAAFLGMESVRALSTVAAGMVPGHQEKLTLFVKLAAGILFLSACVLILFFRIRKKDGRKAAKQLLMFSQLCLPFQFLGYYRFYYKYEAEDGFIQLFYSAKWKWFCFALFAVFLLGQLWCVWKKKTGIYLTTLMMLAVCRVAGTPEGILSVDFFHNGEMAFPMQQLLSYGKIPYFDLDPIHGLCDYFYSLINVAFFDGSYFSQNAAVMAAGMVMAALLAFVMGKCMNNRYAALVLIYLVMPYLVQKAGVRYLLFFAAFFILFSDEIRKDSRKFLWWWVLLCIMGITWNVSIGSSMAVAFLPEILYRVVKDIIPKLKSFRCWDKKEKRNFLIAYGILVIVGLCYIPWFLQILRFLSENAGTTLYVNGTPVFGDEFQPVRTFAFLLPYLVALVYALGGGRKGKSAFISMFTCLLVISNYACVRYDEGARLAVLAVFFMVLYMGTMLAGHKISKGIRWGAVLLCAGMTVYLIQGYLPDLKQNMAAQEVSAVGEVEIMGEKVEDPIVYVSGDSVGMPVLGTGFIQGSTLNSLKNIQTVLNAEAAAGSYLDLTNKISHYVIFDMESVLPFTSAYNISNEKMQEKAISLIGEEKPHMILISPLIQFDLAPVSIRSMHFYTELINMGYTPCVYQDVVYLVEGKPALSEAVDGRRSLGLTYHKEYLGMLPYIWGNSLEESETGFDLQPVEFDWDVISEPEEGNGNIKPVFENSISGTEISFVAVTASVSDIENEQWSFSFVSNVDGQEHRFDILSGTSEGKTDQEEITYLIPVGSSPFWQYSQIQEMEIDGLNGILRMEFYE